ncbi:hypothetical protein CB1_000932059 [Camelus ferus]|nr:hypothetical protein CB1_000932059 [Camelus ferus]
MLWGYHLGEGGEYSYCVLKLCTTDWRILVADFQTEPLHVVSRSALAGQDSTHQTVILDEMILRNGLRTDEIMSQKHSALKSKGPEDASPYSKAQDVEAASAGPDRSLKG